MKIFVLLGVAVCAIVSGIVVVSESIAGQRDSSVAQRGFVLPTWEPHGFRNTDTVAAIRGIAAVGGDWIQIVPTWYQSTRAASDIGRTDSSVSDEDVRYVIGLARGNGLRVLLKPHVDVQDGSDRSLIDPTDRDAWFRSYREFIGHYADLARELGVAHFAVGTELSSLSGDRSRWLTVVDEVKKRFHGPLVYAANHFEYPSVAFWDAVDLVGIDGYWAISQKPTTDVSRLERALAPIRDDLATFAARVGRRILFTEAGYPSQVGAATAPWNAKRSRQPAQDEQAAAYQALLSTFSGQPWWAGVFWWTWNVQHRHTIEPPDALDYSVSGKQAESVVRKWWSLVVASNTDNPVDR